jgi:hypothetical protein
MILTNVIAFDFCEELFQSLEDPLNHWVKIPNDQKLSSIAIQWYYKILLK